MPQFDCAARCQAPDAFFSGAPWLSHPENGTLFIHMESNPGLQDSFLEWQIWNGLNSSSENGENYQISINSQKLPKEVKNGQSQGLKFHYDERWISAKILRIKMFLMLPEPRMDNTIDGDETESKIE